MNALQSGENNFEATLGPACWEAYQAARNAGDIKPPGSPTAFRNWALFSSACSSVAVAGASALAAAMLDPIFAAQTNVAPYKPAGDDPSTPFSPTYAKMMQLLTKAPSRTFSVSANNWNSSTSNAWAKNDSSGFWGLWSGDKSTSDVSKQFASGGVTLDGSFKNVLQIAGTPGVWYSSSALGLAYNNKGTPPWNPKATSGINWDGTFGASSGNMQRFMANLIIVNKMNVKVTSAAHFDSSQQKTITQSGGGGFWPFYSGGSSSGSTTDVAFNADGNMTISITSEDKVAIVVGCVVLPVAQYLGHTVEESKLLMAAR